MFIGGVFVEKLQLTREKIREYARVQLLGMLLWLALYVYRFILAFFIDAEMVSVWFGALSFLAVLMVSAYSLIGCINNLALKLYGYTASKLWETIALVACLVLVAITCWMVAFVMYWPKFLQLCELAPSNPAFILPLGLVVEYLTYAGCVIVRLMVGWWTDYRAWQLVKTTMERDISNGGPYNNDADETDPTPSKRFTFAGFVRHFD